MDEVVTISCVICNVGVSAPSLLDIKVLLDRFGWALTETEGYICKKCVEEVVNCKCISDPVTVERKITWD